MGKAWCSADSASRAHHMFSHTELRVYYTRHALVQLVEKNAMIANSSISTYFMASQKKRESRKRKILDEGRVFSEKWTDEYFFVKTNNMEPRLICKEILSVSKITI